MSKRFGRTNAFIAFLALTPWIAAHPACIPSGTEEEINAALNVNGAKVTLCKKSVFRVSNPIVFSANGQELSTEDESVTSSFAIIKTVGLKQSTAILSRSSNVHLHHLVVDGQREVFGRLVGGGALIELGGDVTGVRVHHVVASNPRGWSTLHVFEGSRLCRGAKVTNNLIGPAGTPDGNWADGISFACRDGLIAYNSVLDATDGGIVVFGSPGTVVENNTIETRKAVLLGGINLVDFAPFDGDYRGVIIRNNRIVAKTGFIKVGIAVGPATWGAGPNSPMNYGGHIENNEIIGSHLGYGIVVDGVRDFDIFGNRATNKLIGGSQERCDPGNVKAGTTFVYDRARSTGKFQREFENGKARWSICIQPITTG
jgi:hypothetical protein